MKVEGSSRGLVMDWGCDIIRPSRRSFIRTLAGGFVLPFATPLSMAYASTPDSRRLLVVLLRGAMDGLAAVPPHGDPSYRSVRGELSLSPSGMIDLDGYFGLHKSFLPIADMWKSGEMKILHASATPYRSRSHFDAQDMLESGAESPNALGTGWLNRAISTIANPPEAIALGFSRPLMMTGPASVSSWSPSWLPDPDEDFLERIESLYVNDRALHDAFMIARNISIPDGAPADSGFVGVCTQAARFMKAADGPRIASVEIGGWDSHANQGADTGRIARLMAVLANGLASYKKEMGPEWSKTAVLIMTEFGRTARPTGSGGTDHGSGSAAFLLSGRPMTGSPFLGDWPGLKKLYEDRDLFPANDIRGLARTVLKNHLGIDDPALDRIIFPGSSSLTEPGNPFT